MTAPRPSTSLNLFPFPHNTTTNAPTTTSSNTFSIPKYPILQYSINLCINLIHNLNSSECLQSPHQRPRLPNMPATKVSFNLSTTKSRHKSALVFWIAQLFCSFWHLQFVKCHKLTRLPDMITDAITTLKDRKGSRYVLLLQPRAANILDV